MWDFPLYPDQASTTAYRVDALYFALLTIAVFFTLLIFVGLTYFAIRYRTGSTASRANAGKDHLGLEITWTVIPLIIVGCIYVWGAKLFFDIHVAPKDAIEIYVVGKQWMWKIQHPQGNKEIDELHVPVGQPVKLILTSQDVIHDFYVPAFRVKQDVLPGRYTTEWFLPTKVGEYHLFCAQYCGTSHAGMVGKVIVMERPKYQEWLAGNAGGTVMASSGEQLFQQFGCGACHKRTNTGRGPSLFELYGRTVQLRGGETVLADQEYLRESIMDPGAKVTAGYTPIMPTFRKQVTAEQVSQLIEYIKTLAGSPAGSQGVPQ